MGRPLRVAAVVAGLFVWNLAAVHDLSASALQSPASAQLKVFLDCQNCFADFLRSEIEFVDYVRDPTEAEVHVLFTRAQTGSGGVEYTIAFIGRGRFQGVDESLKTVTTSSDTDDVVRRQLATSVRVGLLRYLTRDSVPPQLAISVRLGSEDSRPAVSGDRWNNWVFSLRGSASFDGEESSRQRQVGASVSADRITPEWKITLGSELDHETEEFDLDEDDPVKVHRRERDFQWLVVKGLGEHWSLGSLGEIESSTFDNTKLRYSAAPAIEHNVFPYSMYTRRQLRTVYAIGVNLVRYYEVTLFGKIDETLPQHELSLTFEQREQMGFASGTRRVVAVPSRSRQITPRGGRRVVGAAGARPVGGGGGQRLTDPGSALAARTRRNP